MLSACGAGDKVAEVKKTAEEKVSAVADGADEKAAAIDAFADELESDGGALPVTRTQAECVAQGVVDGIGVDQMKQYGFDAGDDTDSASMDQMQFSEHDAEVTAAAFNECVGFRNQIVQQFTAEFDGLSKKGQRCMRRVLNDAAVEKMLVAELTGGSADKALEPYLSKLTRCAQAG